METEFQVRILLRFFNEGKKKSIIQDVAQFIFHTCCVCRVTVAKWKRILSIRCPPSEILFNISVKLAISVT